MTATYNPALPTPRDFVRLQLGDVDMSAPLLSNETLDALLAGLPPQEALAAAADALVAKVSQEPDRYEEGTDGLKIEWKTRIAAWQDLAKRARTGQVNFPTAVTAPRQVHAPASVGRTAVQTSRPGDPGVMQGFRSW